MMNSDISDLRNKTVYIFGAGLAGSSALAHLDDSITVKGFIDNDPSKVGEHVSEYKVFSPERLGNSSFDFILIASEYFEQISNQLITQFSLNHNQIIVLPARMMKPVSLGQSEDIANNALTVLYIVTQSLNYNAVNYHVDAGTLLGIYRDGQLIPWDDDLDIAINASDIEHAKTAINQAIASLNVQFNCQWQLIEYYSSIQFRAVNKGALRSFKLQATESEEALPMMDFFVKYIEGDRMDYTLSSRGISMPSKHILNTVDFKFKNQIVRFPEDVEDYLTAHYGDWKTPVRDWDLSMLKNSTVF